MKIPNALEEMVAGLISDEKSKREEVEAVLSQIHSLTEAYFNPDAPVVVLPADAPEPEPQLAAPISQERLFENAVKFNERRGDDKFTAERKAKLQFGIED